MLWGEDGEVMVGTAMPLGLISRVEEVKLWAIVLGARFTLSCGLPRVELESDCANVVDKLRHASPDLFLLVYITEFAKRLLDSFSCEDVVAISRSQNKVADKLAKYVVSLLFTYFWFGHGPNYITSVFKADLPS